MTTTQRKLITAAMTAGLGFAASAAQASELTFWSMWNEPEPQAAALRAITEAYTAAHPETTFKIVWNGRGNQTKLRSALQAGTKVDLMDQDGDQLAGGLQKQGQALQLDGLVSPDFKELFLPGTYDIYADGDKHYQVPYIYNTVNFWYSKDMMAEAGAQPPKTWDELLKVCEDVRKIDKHALVLDSGYEILIISNLLERQLGANAVVKIFEDKSGDAWLDPVVLKSAKMAIGLWDNCLAPDTRGFQYPAGQQTIALGDSMAELVGSWLPTELAEATGPDFPWGAFNFPAVEGGKGAQTDLQVALLSMVALKDTQHPEEAASFLQFLMSEEAQKILVETGNVGVTRKGVAWPAVLADAYHAAEGATALSNVYGGVGVYYPDFFTNVFDPEQRAMFFGQKTPDEFVTIMAAQTKAYWEKQ